MAIVRVGLPWRLLALLQPLSYADLQKPGRHDMYDERGDGDGPPALGVIYGNWAHHCSQHQRWIAELSTSAPGAERLQIDWALGQAA
jgi:hypothetical protein